MSALEEAGDRPQLQQAVSAPCSSNTFAAVIQGRHIDFALCTFGETDFLCITEYQKIGTVVEVEIESSQVVEGPNRIYSVRVLLGEDSEAVRAAARFLAGQLSTRKRLIVTLALKGLERTLLKLLVPVIREHSVPLRQ